MAVSNQFQAPAVLLPWKNHATQWVRGWVDPIADPDSLQKEKIS